MKKLFDVNNSYHGDGTLCYSWQADGSYLASVGSNSLLVIFDRHGQQVLVERALSLLKQTLFVRSMRLLCTVRRVAWHLSGIAKARPLQYSRLANASDLLLR